MTRSGVTRIAGYTWARQRPAALLEGLALGVIGLAPFAVKRSLGAPEWVVPFLIALWQVGWVFSPAVGNLLASADPQRLWRRLAYGAYLPVLGVAFVAVTPGAEPGHGTGNVPLFLGLVLCYYLTQVAQVPHRGAMLRANYPVPVRGRMFGFVVALQLLASAAAAKSAGILLDLDPTSLRVLFPAAALCGIGGYLL